MKRTLLIIVATIIVSYCAFPFQINFEIPGENLGFVGSEHGDNDDALQKTENISINYARKDKRVKIERYTRTVERATAENAVEYHVKNLNDSGLLRESIKRDYSGDDWIDGADA